MIVDPVEDVGQVGLRVEAVHLRGFDDRHGAGQGFAAGIRAGKQPVAAADAQFPFILPMSAKFIGFIINGMPILART